MNITGTNNYARSNPFRYRGYYLDTETGLYYLQSRYYDPAIGRFISADGQLNGGILGNNLYSYCENDPVNYYDPNGEFAVSAIIIGAIIGAAIGFGATAYVDYADDGRIFNGSVSTEGYVVNTIVGGVVGAFTGGIGSSTFTFSIPSLALLETTIGTLELVVVGTTTITVNGLLVVGAGLAGIGVVLSQWEPGSWPGDDPTQPPGDGFVWRGPGEVGSNRGEWYNPQTGDQLHPDLNHPLPKGPHWGWRNKIKRMIIDIFKNN